MDDISAITLPSQLKKTDERQRHRQRILNLFEEYKTVEYKVFTTDMNNKIIFNIDDVNHRMFATTTEEVQEFLKQLFLKYETGYNFYIYDTYNIYVNRTNSKLKQYSYLQTSLLQGNNYINSLLQFGKIPGKIYKVEITFNLIEESPEETSLYPQIQNFIPSLDEVNSQQERKKNENYSL